MESLGKRICKRLTISEIIGSVPSKTFTSTEIRTRNSLLAAIECKSAQVRLQIRQAAEAKESVLALKAKMRMDRQRAQRREKALLKRKLMCA
jgi:hypothetical protein